MEFVTSELSACLSRSGEYEIPVTHYVVISYPSHFTVHVTDIHYALDRVEQLKLWLKAHNQKLDVILVSGDIANAPMDWTLSDEQLRKYQSDLEAVIDSLSQVKSNVYYIPGNVRNYFTL